MIAQEHLSSADPLGAPRFGRRHGRPHRGGHRGIRLFPTHHVQYVYPESYNIPYGQSVEEEVNAYVGKNECIVLRRGADDTMIRREVVNALKARGWEERVDVRPRGGFSEKTLILCPPAASTAPPLSGRINGLGQVAWAKEAEERAAGFGLSAALGIPVATLLALLFPSSFRMDRKTAIWYTAISTAIGVGATVIPVEGNFFRVLSRVAGVKAAVGLVSIVSPNEAAKRRAALA
ncbi:MAG: hypothetical protein ACRD1Z_04975 [Vicinamibacteria bacterium]